MPSSPLRRTPWLVLLGLATCSAIAGCRCNAKPDSETGPSRVENSDEPAAQPPPYSLRQTASAGSATLVAWRAAGSERGIRAARFDARGAPLDPKPIVVSAGRHDTEIALAGYADGFWLVWEHFPQGRGVNVHGRRVARDGSLLDAEPRRLTGPDGTQRSPSIACAKSGCLLAYHDFRKDSYGGLHVVRLAKDGQTGKPLPLPGKSHDSSAVAASSAGFVIAFTGGLDSKHHVYSVLLPEELGATPAEPQRIAQSDRNSDVKIACNAQRCFAAWTHWEKVEGGPRHQEINGTRVYVTPSRGEIWGTLLDAKGAVPNGSTPRKLRALEAGPRRLESLALAASAGGFLLAWESTTYGEQGRSSAGVLRIGPGGDSEEVALPTARPTTSGPGEGWLVTLSKRADPSNWLLLARVTQGGALEWAIQPTPLP